MVQPTYKQQLNPIKQPHAYHFDNRQERARPVRPILSTEHVDPTTQYVRTHPHMHLLDHKIRVHQGHLKYTPRQSLEQTLFSVWSKQGKQHHVPVSYKDIYHLLDQVHQGHLNYMT